MGAWISFSMYNTRNITNWGTIKISSPSPRLSAAFTLHGKEMSVPLSPPSELNDPVFSLSLPEVFFFFLLCSRVLLNGRKLRTGWHFQSSKKTFASWREWIIFCLLLSRVERNLWHFEEMIFWVCFISSSIALIQSARSKSRSQTTLQIYLLLCYLCLQPQNPASSHLPKPNMSMPCFRLMAWGSPGNEGSSSILAKQRRTGWECKTM